MASLVEELLDVLKKEKEGYDAILSMCEEKRDSIVHSKIDVLDGSWQRRTEPDDNTAYRTSGPAARGTEGSA